jgi:hypothetical protein
MLNINTYSVNFDGNSQKNGEIIAFFNGHYADNNLNLSIRSKDIEEFKTEKESIIKDFVDFIEAVLEKRNTTHPETEEEETIEE